MAAARESLPNPLLERVDLIRFDEATLIDCKNSILKHLFEDETFVEKYGRHVNLVESEFLSYMALHLAQGGKPQRACKYLKDSMLLQPSSIFSRRFLAVVKHIILSTFKSN